MRNSVCSVSAAHLSSPCRGGTGAALRPREVLADGIRGVRLRFVRRRVSVGGAWGRGGGTIFCDDSCSCPATALAGYCAKSERDDLHIVAVRCEGLTVNSKQ